jgi:hypothetical protein
MDGFVQCVKQEKAQRRKKTLFELNSNSVLLLLGYCVFLFFFWLCPSSLKIDAWACLARAEHMHFCCYGGSDI